MNNKSEQVGGDHYTKLPLQPWDIIEQNDLDYFSGNCIKYILRHKKKWPEDTQKQREDLLKCKHYLQYMLDRLDAQFSDT